ncbi:MAG TPA: cation:proton antiporter [Thermomicrobiales bacterium]|nr:cation:proton antiporter [Thermomicrobiales bacterium]
MLAFAVCLLLAVLVSGLAHRTMLSTAVLFLFAGFIVGDTLLGFVSLFPDDPVVTTFAELALFSVLFTDGMRVGFRDLVSAWRLPGRALLLGLPLTLLGNALLAYYVAGLPWAESFLIGAVLSPTDPVFAAAIVGREEVPSRLRHLLNVESGINDGLALPFVIAFLAIASEDPFDAALVSGEVALGIGIGIVIPFAAIALERSRFFGTTTLYQPLNAFSIGLVVLGLSVITHANEFLAAFAAGVTVATMSPAVRSAFHQFGELITELLKLAALLVFGALISIEFLREIEPSGYLFAFLVLIVVRPAALGIALMRSPLTWREWVAAAWFGPKGFASVVYALLILEAGIPLGDEIFHLVAIVIIGSIIAHSSTDVLVARWFHEPEEESAPAGSNAMD